jgi:carbamoyl-phosphate synthase large subunit
VPSIGHPGYIPTLLSICKTHQVKIILSFLDGDIGALAAARKEFTELGATPLIASEVTNQICFDKWNTFSFLTREGFTCPMTYNSITSVQAALDDGSLSFPLIVKPRNGSASINVFTARNQSELEVFFHYAEGMIIQPKLKGTEFGVDVCTNLAGEVMTVVVKRKVTMRSGETDQAEIVDNPAIEAVARRLGALLKVPGPLDIDVIEVEGVPYVLEMNPRFGGGYPLAHLAGANFPSIIMAMVRGEPIPDVLNKHQRGVVAMKDLSVYGGPKEKVFGSLIQAANL